jgi:copper homeostasis protein
MITLEVACGNLASVKAAQAGGANRVELCAALGAGGLTPSDAFIRAAINLVDIPVFVMIRPREGDFLYSDEEFSLMLEEVERCKELGVPGIVAGFLKRDGSIDRERSEKLVAAAGKMEVTFHRAFDLSNSDIDSLDRIIDCGFTRLLTSGQQSAAPKGVACIAKLVQRANDKIKIMAGAGVNSSNVLELIQQTGVKEIHLSGKQNQRSAMEYVRPSLSMGNPEEDEYSIAVTDAGQIRAVRTLIDQL